MGREKKRKLEKAHKEKRKKAPMANHKCRIRAVADSLIEPGHGLNMAVQFHYSKQVKKRLPSDPSQVTYLLEPSRSHHDLSSATLGSLPTALIHGGTSHLPFANLGRTPIRVRKGEILGIARVYEPTL